MRERVEAINGTGLSGEGGVCGVGGGVRGWAGVDDLVDLGGGFVGTRDEGSILIEYFHAEPVVVCAQVTQFTFCGNLDKRGWEINGVVRNVWHND